MWVWSQSIRKDVTCNVSLHWLRPFSHEMIQQIHKTVGYCKKDLTPLLTHWSYIFLALTHWTDPKGDPSALFTLLSSTSFHASSACFCAACSCVCSSASCVWEAFSASSSWVCSFWSWSSWARELRMTSLRRPCRVVTSSANADFSADTLDNCNKTKICEKQGN